MPLARPHRRSPAFTLLELFTVMAVVALLATISLGVISSTKQRANMARAKAELALLVQALEGFKRHYGDYPQTGPSALNSQRVTGTVGAATAQAVLFNSLLGVYGPRVASGGRLNGPRLVDIQKFKLEVEPTTAQLANFGVPSGSPRPRTFSTAPFWTRGVIVTFIFIAPPPSPDARLRRGARLPSSFIRPGLPAGI